MPARAMGKPVTDIYCTVSHKKSSHDKASLLLPFHRCTKDPNIKMENDQVSLGVAYI